MLSTWQISTSCTCGAYSTSALSRVCGTEALPERNTRDFDLIAVMAFSAVTTLDSQFLAQAGKATRSEDAVETGASDGDCMFKIASSFRLKWPRGLWLMPGGRGRAIFRS